MRFIKPTGVEGLARVSPFTWRNLEDEGSFVVDIRPDALPFICVFVQADVEQAAPKATFDVGQGFDDLTAIAFRPFPFAFYHVSLARIGAVRRIRFRACLGVGAKFRCVIFEFARPLAIAVLHYLFNLRYQKIGIVAPTEGGKLGTVAYVRSNVARIRTFFTTVSAGGGMRVQQAEDDVLERMCLWQTRAAEPIRDAMRDRLAPRAGGPLLSFVVPVYNTKPEHLRDLLDSFATQDADYAELILADDGSTSAATRTALAEAVHRPGVRLATLDRNAGIAAATNAGIAAARGEWVGFIDHDDAFASSAIAIMAQAILGHPEALFFYTDEAIANAALRTVGAFCKPAYDPVLLSGSNYINHFSIFRRARLEALGGLRLDCEGSQDYDLLLRYLAGAPRGAVVHIPFLAYVWRRGDHSYSAVFRERSVANAREALRRAHAGAGAVTIEPARNPELHRVRFVDAAQPRVSVVIPNRDSLALIERIVADVSTRTNYPDLEIVVPDNGTTDRRVLDFYDKHRSDRFRIERIEEPFNFSRMCNRGARLADADLILFLNNDIEVIEPDWLSEMVECLCYAGTGIVGAKLLYPNGRIQHAGVIVGLGEAAGHWFVDEDTDEPGPMSRLAVRQTIGAVTGACMLVTRACFDAVGGFDEDAFPIAYNDVDFCIRAKALGFRTIWTPFATLRHYESLSRGSDSEGESNIRFRAEFGRLQDRHGTKTMIDEAFSPFYDRRYSRPHLFAPPELSPPRANTLP